MTGDVHKKARTSWKWGSPLFLLILSLFALAIAFMPHASVPWAQFELRLRDVLAREGFMAERVYAPDAKPVPLPLVVYFRSTYWRRPGKGQADSDYPELGLRYLVKHGQTSKLELLAPHLNSEVCAIYLRTTTGNGWSAGEQLRSALEREFPGLPIDLDSRKAALFDDSPRVGE